MRLKRRLGRVEAWAEKQGLELAADCHLCRIIQVSHTSSLRNENFNLDLILFAINFMFYYSISIYNSLGSIVCGFIFP
jgi:hypothetical protein